MFTPQILKRQHANSTDQTTAWNEGTEGNGVGVVGSNENGRGIGVRAISKGGIGLLVEQGRIRVDQVSGVATIKAGKRKVTVKPGFDVNRGTFILLSPLGKIGTRTLSFTKNAGEDRFAIQMSRPRGKATRVAWLALEKG